MRLFLFEIKISLHNKTLLRVCVYEKKIPIFEFKMLQKQTWVNVTDGTNVKWLQIFHLYKGSFRKKSGEGQFVKGSARVVLPPRLEYKGFKIRFNLKGDICRALIVRTKFQTRKSDGSKLLFKDNGVILIKKKQDLKSKYFYGPAASRINRKRFLACFKWSL